MISLFISNSPSTNKVISNNGSSVTTSLTPPILLNPNKKYEMRLLSASIVYCEPNISSTLNNNKLDYNVDGTNFSITFPSGLYSLNDINTQISLFTLENNSDASMISFIANEANSTIYLYADTPLTVYASHANSIMQILGFSTSDITLSASGYVNGENQANLNTLQTILVTCDVVTDSYFNSQVSNIIAAITPNVSPYSTILYTPVHPTRVKIYTSQINQITFTLTDQSGAMLIMNPKNNTAELWNVVVSIEPSEDVEKTL